MTQTLKFVIGAGETARQEETFTVSSACSHLCFRYDLSKKYTFLVFLMIKDPSGKIRFLKQLGYSDPVIVLGKMETILPSEAFREPCLREPGK